jgi:hypothetical protein
MLYQLSYASPEVAISSLMKPPSHPENVRRPEDQSTGTLSLRTYCGTVFKVSTASAAEQTAKADFGSLQAVFLKREIT